MTSEELERLLAQQPVALLHRLARGRIHRHFRAGKRRLIELLLRHSAENRAGFESDVLTLIGERQTRSSTSVQPTPSRQTPSPPQSHRRPIQKPAEPESHEPAVSLAAWLEGIGVPPPRPFVPDAWQDEALVKLAEGDVIVLSSDAGYTVSAYQGQVVIDLGGGDQLGLAGVSSASFSSSWIVVA